MTITYVFLNTTRPQLIKMIEAQSPAEAQEKLAQRLAKEVNSGTPADYSLGYRM
jgi:hypothetical protein